jgi:molecular chaperone HscB
VRINEAYQRLKEPLKRAAYLCELNGAPIDAENNTAMPKAFLMEQMEWREALEEASTEADLDQLSAQLMRSRRHILQELEALLDDRRDYAQAAQQVRALMFIERFAADIEARIEKMDNGKRGQ